MKILITGASGFVGRHLIKYLIPKGYEIWALTHTNQEGFSLADHVVQVELNEFDKLSTIIAQIQPSYVFHLAGVLGNASYKTLYEVNVLGTIHLLEALRTTNCMARILISSSSGVYGATEPEQNPLNENCPLSPISHYATSKLAQENVGRQYHYAFQMPVIIARAFNLLGPGQSPVLLASSLARQIAQLELGQVDEPIYVGNLWPRRDYVDVRDAVRAFVSLIEKGEPGQSYNVCTSQSYSVQDCVNVLLAQARIPLQIQQDTRRMRAKEIADQIGNPVRLQQATDWQATIPFEQSLVDLLDYWRAILKKEMST